jgi:hypothetical protein
MQADAVLPAYPYPCKVEERTIIKDHKKLKTQNDVRQKSYSIDFSHTWMA